jgi:hypothetical protein
MDDDNVKENALRMTSEVIPVKTRDFTVRNSEYGCKA